MPKKKSTNYRLLMRSPDEVEGRTVGTGSLTQLRNAVENFDSLGGLEPGYLLYIVLSSTPEYAGGIYEGYYVNESGRVVLGYKKYPYRMSRGPYATGLGWGKYTKGLW